MDIEVATWLAEMIRDSLGDLENDPGLTVEVAGNASVWAQVVPEADDAGILFGFVVNLPDRDFGDDPLSRLTAVGIKLPPDTKVLDSAPGSHVTLWIRPDVPLVALALLIGDLFEKVGGAAQGSEISIQVEYGF